MRLRLYNAKILPSPESKLIDGEVLIENGTIRSIGAGAPRFAADREIDCRGNLLMSGFCNAHAHAAMCLFRGIADDLTLERWLYDRIFPLEDKLTPEDVYAGTLQIDWHVLYLAVPVGLITVAILHCNNTRDIATDNRADIRTLAMNIGGKASVWLYCFEVIFPFFWLTGCIIAGILPVWCLLAWVAGIPALQNVRMSIGYFRSGPAAIAGLDEATAKLQLVFSLLLALSLVLSGLFS